MPLSILLQQHGKIANQAQEVVGAIDVAKVSPDTIGNTPCRFTPERPGVIMT